MGLVSREWYDQRAPNADSCWSCLAHALRARSNRMFWILDLHWRSPRSVGLWYTSRQLSKMIWSRCSTRARPSDWEQIVISRTPGLHCRSLDSSELRYTSRELKKAVWSDVWQVLAVEGGAPFLLSSESRKTQPPE